MRSNHHINILICLSLLLFSFVSNALSSTTDEVLSTMTFEDNVATATAVTDSEDYTSLTTETTNLGTTSTSSALPSPTLVWVTVTNNGNPATVQVTYTQKFRSFYTSVAQPSSGSIGLGTIKGKIGTIRTYRVLTVSNTASSTASSTT